MEEENCPFCERENTPGAYDVCEHYLGAIYDGEWCGELGDPVWRTEFLAVLDRLEALRTLVEERAEADRDNSDLELQVRAFLDEELAEAVLLGWKTPDLLMRSSPAVEQEHPILHTMTSGWGASFYTDDLGGQLRWVRGKRAVLEELKRRCFEVFG